MIRVENLTKIYKTKRQESTCALNNISFTLPDKGLVFIIGKSGSGKSTLLNLIGGLDKITSGDICCFGNSLAKMSTREQEDYRNTLVGFIFQDFHLIDDLTVYENIRLALDLQNVQDDAAIHEALEKVGLKGYENRYPTEISGGEQQRVAIARALVKNPKVILADEPTGNLDSKTTTQIIGLMKEISKDKLVVTVSHNLLDAYEYADRILELADGTLLKDLDRDAAYAENVVIHDGVLTIPLIKKLNETELGCIEEALATGKVKKLRQKDNKFKKAIEPEYKVDFVRLWKKTFSIKNQIKLCWKFSKKRTFQSVMSAVIAAGLVIVLILCQTMIYFDQGKVMINELGETNGDVMVLKKTEMEGYTNMDMAVTYLTDSEYEELIQKIEAENIYRMTNYSIGITSLGSLCQERDVGHVPFKSEYIAYTLGNLECDEEFVIKKFGKDGKLDIYTGDVEYKKSGIYITDYVADAIITLGNLDAKTYDDILGDYSIYKPNSKGVVNYRQGYINGVIKTDYKEKYASVINFMQNKEMTLRDLPKDDPLFLEFYDEVAQYLGITYTFEENFIENVVEDRVWNFLYINNLKINDIPVTERKSFMFAKADYMVDMDLEYDEVVIDYRLCNELLASNYSLERWQEEPLQDVHVVRSHYVDAEHKDPIFDLNVHLRPELVPDGKIIIISDELMQENVLKQFICTDLYIEGAADLDALTRISEEYGMSANSITLGSIISMSYTVRVFQDFFKLIFIVLCGVTVLILVRFGRKIVKDRIYEIGVIKALGGKTRSFLLIFGLQVVALGAIICLFTVLGAEVFVNLANDILIISWQSMIDSYIITDMQVLLIDKKMVFADVGAVMLLSLLATVIPIISLNRIKPIGIIKAKE